MSQKVADIDFNQLFSANFGYTLHLLTHAQVFSRFIPVKRKKGSACAMTISGSLSGERISASRKL